MLLPCQAIKCYHKKYFPSQRTHKKWVVGGSSWLSNERAGQINFKAKVAGNPHTRTLVHTHTHVQPVKVTNRVAIKFHMLITCVGLVTPTHILPPTIQRPLQFTILTDRWRQIALASLSALSHVTCRIYMLRSTHTVFWRQLYRNIFAILS